MTNQTEQPKMYKCLNKYGYGDIFDVGKTYSSNEYYGTSKPVSYFVEQYPEDWQLVEPEQNWVCNECNMPNFTSSVSEAEIEQETHTCINCGCFEFHKEPVKNPKQKPFAPTHEVTDGEYKNERVVILERGKNGGDSIVENEAGEDFYTPSDWLSPLPTKTHLSESQYESLVDMMRDVTGFNLRGTIKIWAEINQIELP